MLKPLRGTGSPSRGLRYLVIPPRRGFRPLHRTGRLRCGFDDCFGKERPSSLPVTGCPDPVWKFGISLPVHLK